MAITIGHDAQYIKPSLPPGPVTETRWYRTHSGGGLLVIRRRATVDSGIESVTFYAELFGRVRRLRLRYPNA